MPRPDFETDSQRQYAGPQELRLFADFLPHIGEFTLMFAKVERHVTWAIESFLGATRWDGNELEGMVQNFSSRIKFLDIAARPRCRTDDEKNEQANIIRRLRELNKIRNNLMHNSATGVRQERDENGGLTKLSIQLKRLDGNTGKEHSIQIYLSDLQQMPADMSTLIGDLRRWTHHHCPNAERHVP